MGIFDRFNRQKPVPTIPKLAPRVRSLSTGQYNVAPKYAEYRQLFASPNSTIRANLSKAREASRTLAEKDGYMRKYLDMLSVYVIGDNGMQFLPQVVDNNGVLDTDANDILKKAWKEWCETASYDGQSTFTDLQDMAVKGLGRDGEMFFRLVRGPKVGNRFGFALHPVDPSLVHDGYNGPIGQTNSVVMGIEFANVRPVAYHIWTQFVDMTSNSGNRTRELERVPANEIIHVFEKEYGSEVRGLPWIVPAIPTLYDLYDFTAAHLQASKLAASIPLVLEYTDARTVATGFDSNGAKAAINAATSQDEPQPIQSLDITYQQIVEVPYGQKLGALNLAFPQQSYQETVAAYVAQIAAGLGMSYATFSGDNGNDTSATIRHGSQTERDYWKKIQTSVAEKFHKKVYRAWLEASIIAGALPFKVGDIDRLSKCEFRPRGFRSIDPTKDLKGFAIAIDYGFTTRSLVAQEIGVNDYEDLLRLKQREMELESKYGVNWVDSGKQAQNTNPPLVTEDTVTQPAPDEEQ